MALIRISVLRLIMRESDGLTSSSMTWKSIRRTPILSFQTFGNQTQSPYPCRLLLKLYFLLLKNLSWKPNFWTANALLSSWVTRFIAHSILSLFGIVFVTKYVFWSLRKYAITWECMSTDLYCVSLKTWCLNYRWQSNTQWIDGVVLGWRWQCSEVAILSTCLGAIHFWNWILIHCLALWLCKQEN